MSVFQTPRVRRPAEHESLLAELVESTGKQYSDILLVAAGIGLKHSLRQTFRESVNQIRFDIFEKNDDATNFITLLALSSSSLKNEDAVFDQYRARFDDRIKIFEEYACGGLSWVAAKAREQTRKPAQVMREEVEATLLKSEALDDEPFTDLLGASPF